MAELEIELRSKMEYLPFQLNSSSDQKRPLQLGIECLALLTSSCNLAVMQEMPLSCTFMNRSEKNSSYSKIIWQEHMYHTKKRSQKTC